MRIARRRSSSPEISLVSTSDVAFLLLIFFLSTAALSVERGLLLELPRAGDTSAVLPASRIVAVRVSADGSFDLVVAFEIIEHLTNWRAFLREVRPPSEGAA